ncbi:hypothetical protein Thpro_022716 [Acidihalobacter prosperus]|uniref:Uncharacterized protein n=1 Tax=Acidihalobacter prosperus TaxID=160660 RepID=A0A1A6C1M0_9GAMM|nr:hypothetical protein Thpro_022716 [Acidihalobacter prosperus]
MAHRRLNAATGKAGRLIVFPYITIGNPAESKKNNKKTTN